MRTISLRSAQLVNITYDIIEVERVTLFLVDEVRKELICVVSKDNEFEGTRLSIGKGIAGHVAREGVTQVIEDVSTDHRFNEDIDQKTSFEVSERSERALMKTEHSCDYSREMATDGFVHYLTNIISLNDIRLARLFCSCFIKNEPRFARFSPATFCACPFVTTERKLLR